MAIGRCYTSHLSRRSNRRIFDAESHRDRVGTLETDASDVSGKPIGVLGHDLHGLRAVGLEDANRPGGADPVGVKEDHDLSDDLLLRPGVRDPFGSNRPDARHLSKAIGLGLDDVEDLLSERFKPSSWLRPAQYPGSCRSPDISRSHRLTICCATISTLADYLSSLDADERTI
jgi:hypothetical protein